MICLCCNGTRDTSETKHLMACPCYDNEFEEDADDILEGEGEWWPDWDIVTEGSIIRS